MSNTAPAEHEADAERIAQANDEIDQRVAQRVDAELAGLDLTDSQRRVCRAEFYRQESGAVLRARGIDPLVFAEWRMREVHVR